MKKIILVLYTAAVALSTYGQADSMADVAVTMASEEAQWEAAGEMYATGRYDAASTLYAVLIEQHGIANPYLYYNAANSFFKQNETAKAILFYERALRLAPNDDDILHNLEIAQQHTIDKIEAVPVFFAVRWLAAIPRWFGAGTWGCASLFFFAAALVALLLINIVRRRMAVLLVAATMAVLSLIALRTMISAIDTMLAQNYAIVMSAVTTIKSSPDNSSTDLFILHEGAKVEILETIGSYAKIRIADGNQGWMLLNSMEII